MHRSFLERALLAIFSLLLTVPTQAQVAAPAVPGGHAGPAGPLAPVAPRPRSSADSAEPLPRLIVPEDLFGNVDQRDRLSGHRRRLAQSPAASAVFGAESKGRATTDVGNLIRKALSSHGVATQDRTPIVTDTRVRGQRAGQVLASGSFWTPVRSDLDTMMNKIDSRLVQDVILIKGPYSSRYGPGLRFVDFDLLQTPRYNSYETHGSSSFDYDTNGEQAYGRQTLTGGDQDWGFLVSYGHRAGTDYETGAGTSIPAGYKSRDLFVALGWDASAHEHFEFNYLRLDQTDVEFPGLVFDLDYLVTDGYEVKYVNTRPGWGDRVDAEVWYNQTRFGGNTLRSGKDRQIPTLIFDLFSPSGFDGFGVTDAEGKSMGYRSETTFGQEGDVQTSVGFDLTHVRQHLNDIEPLLPDPDDNNFPIPPSYSVDFGLFAEHLIPVDDTLLVTLGARLDFLAASADSEVQGVPDTLENLHDVDSLQQEYVLWSLYLTAEQQLNDVWTMTYGAGHGQRPPTLTELYALAPFIGSLQRGLTALNGDPELDEERMTQIDAGLRADYDGLRLGANGHIALVRDLITYDLLSPAGGAGGLGGFPQSAQFVNTDKALLAGFETWAEMDLQTWLTAFGTLSYLEGRDLSRETPSRLSTEPVRSDVVGRNSEPLPGIAPLESRLGLRLHEPSSDPRWGLEFAARIVDNQDRFAGSLEEIATPGFTTYDMRFFGRQGPWLFTAGIENITNKFYREHLDYRSGLGVFRPGVNFYSGVEVTY